MHNTLLHIFTVLNYFGELIAIGMKQDIEGETVDSILVKEGRVEITFLFHSICVISQYCFYQNIMIPYTLKFMIVLKCYTFFYETIRLRPKTALNLYILLASF